MCVYGRFSSPRPNAACAARRKEKGSRAKQRPRTGGILPLSPCWSCRYGDCTKIYAETWMLRAKTLRCFSRDVSICLGSEAGKSPGADLACHGGKHCRCRPVPGLYKNLHARTCILFGKGLIRVSHDRHLLRCGVQGLQPCRRSPPFTERLPVNVKKSLARRTAGSLKTGKSRGDERLWKPSQ